MQNCKTEILIFEVKMAYFERFCLHFSSYFYRFLILFSFGKFIFWCFLFFKIFSLIPHQTGENRRFFAPNANISGAFGRKSPFFRKIYYFFRYIFTYFLTSENIYVKIY